MEWYILDSKHEPVLSTAVGSNEWCNTTPGIRFVAQDLWRNWFWLGVREVRVSTIFLGLDHSFNEDDPKDLPVLFETMIFGKFNDDYQIRYTTWEEAVEGHKRALMIAKTQRSI